MKRLNYQIVTLVLVFAGLYFSANAQQSIIKYRVIDKETGEPLPFVNVQVVGEHRGTTTDLDGYFVAPATESNQRLQFTNVGYAPLSIIADSIIFLKKHRVEMQPTIYQVGEVTINSRENPALRIIRQTVANRDRNNPDKYSSFSFISYNKFFYTSSTDTVGLRERIMAKDTLSGKDSARLNTLNKLAKSNLFLIETINKRRYQHPGRNEEEVLASRVSGLKEQPLFALIASQLQSLSFYSPTITLFTANYLNPISPIGMKGYFFLIEDTVLTQHGDTTFVISFRPHKNRNFDAMKGVLQITTNGFAIKNVIAEPNTPGKFIDTLKVSLKIQQNYQAVEGKWFPAQLSSELRIYSESKEHRQMNAPIVGIGRTYLTEIKVNDPEVKVAALAPALSFSPKAEEQSEEFWNRYRLEQFTDKDRNTYTLVDSLSKANKLNRKMGAAMAVASGNIPWGLFDFPLNRIIGYNQHEGFRLGLGVTTGNKVSKVFKVGGYGAYGFDDKTYKYGGFAQANLHRNMQWMVMANYSHDVAESGAILASEQTSMFSREGIYPFFYDEMDKVEQWNLQTSLRPMRHIKLTIEGNYRNFEPTTAYQFTSNAGRLLDQYEVTSAAAELRFAYGEGFLILPGSAISTGTTVPIVKLRYEHGFEGGKGDIAYNKLLFRCDYSHNFPLLGLLSVSANAGKVWEAVPMGLLFNAHGSNIQHAKPRNYNIEVAGSFGTVYPGEFYSDQFAYLFLRHSFRNLLFKSKHFSPRIMVAANVGVGETSHLNRHQGYQFRKMDKGLYEVGLGIENLLNPVWHLYQKVAGGGQNYLQNLGFSAFYRMGPYAYEKQCDNLFFKISVGFNL